MNLEFPRMVVRDGTAWTLETGRYDLRVVADQDEYDAALADGWHASQEAARAAASMPDVVLPDDAPPTREELETKARELGIKFDGRTSDKKLGEQIEAKLKG